MLIWENVKVKLFSIINIAIFQAKVCISFLKCLETTVIINLNTDSSSHFILESFIYNDACFLCMFV